MQDSDRGNEFKSNEGGLSTIYSSCLPYYTYWKLSNSIQDGNKYFFLNRNNTTISQIHYYQMILSIYN